MSETTYFIIGTTCMVTMMITIIIFVRRFQEKLAARNKAYLEIEWMIGQQELKSAYALLEGQEIERKRIAAELHDNIGGLLSTLKMYSDLTVPCTDLSELARLNQKVNELTEDLGLEVRKLSHELDLRTLSGFGFKVAIQQLSEAITATGKMELASVVEISSAIEDKVSLNLYRIIQELVTNTLKHAQATRARIELVSVDRELCLIYEDNGKGFDTASGKTGMGLKNITMRTELIGGKLAIDSTSIGTTVIIEIERNGQY